MLAIIVAHAAHAHEPAYFTTDPVHAMNKALSKAFAVVPMIAISDMDLDHAKVNVNVGARVLGHPIVAYSARIMATLLRLWRNYARPKVRHPSTLVMAK